MDRVVVTSHDELLAALPHVMGFQVAESVITIPLGAELPTARIDIPKTAAERRQVVGTLRGAYARHVGRSGAALGIVCLTGDRRAAEATTRALARALERISVQTPLRLWATERRWTDLNSGESGWRSGTAETRMAAEATAMGRPAPAPSRESLADVLRGDRAPVAAVLGQAWAAARANPETAERAWATDRLARFHTDGQGLTDTEAARMLVALQSKPTRDVLWTDMVGGELREPHCVVDGPDPPCPRRGEDSGREPARLRPLAARRVSQGVDRSGANPSRRRALPSGGPGH